MAENKTKDTRPHVVFVATDLSEPSNEAIRQAHRRAEAADATLVVCHIVPNLLRSNMLFPQRYMEQAEAQAELNRRAQQALVERTCEVTGRDPAAFRPIVDDGTAYSRIIEHAEEAGADLIVVGDRGATGLTRVLLGSVAERVIRYAHAPVLVARAAASTGKVLVATDLSDPSLPALTAAAREAVRKDVQVTALHCIEPVGVVAAPEYGIAWAPEVNQRIVKDAREGAEQQLAAASQRFDLQAKCRVVEGFPAATILSIAEELQAELIVIGTRGNTGLKRVLLGSVAEAVVRHAACSVLVVRLAEDAGKRQKPA